MGDEKLYEEMKLSSSCDSEKYCGGLVSLWWRYQISSDNPLPPTLSANIKAYHEIIGILKKKHRSQILSVMMEGEKRIIVSCPPSTGLAMQRIAETVKNLPFKHFEVVIETVGNPLSINCGKICFR